MLQNLVVKARRSRVLWQRCLVVLLCAGLGGVAAVARHRPAVPSTVSRAGVLAPILRRAAVRGAADERADAERAQPGQADAERACLARISALGDAQAPLPAADVPELRAQLLARTKSVPVLFLEEPAASRDAQASALRRSLEESPGYASFDRVVGAVRKSPELARAVFLRDSYLYSVSPELAPLFGSLTLSLLFREPELVIVRGSERLSARRSDDGSYEYESGPERGRPAKLLLFDRIAPAGVNMGPLRHADLRGLRAQLGFDELSLRALRGSELSVLARYGELSVPTLLRADQGELVLECEAPERGRALLQALRASAASAARVQARLLSVIKEQVDEALPFDEPKTEDGQQDGKLRPEWRRAYLNGSSSFEFNGDRYAVFDAAGRPRPPQVCIDFVLDTFERASGTWWQPRAASRQRVLGRLRFDDEALENRRSVESFLDFAKLHPESFDVYQPAPEARIPLRSRAQFFGELYRTRAQFRPGDIVAILGPRDDEKLHYHSFLIVAADPLSGMPTELAANAGRPRIRSWEAEMQNAPRRHIFARIRPRALWLESFLGPERTISADAPAEPHGPASTAPAAG